jgi:branched-chain amino acid aminotransferase
VNDATTIPICVLTPDGVQPAPYTASSFADAATSEPPGVYTIGRTYQRDHALLMDDHLNRLEQSARLEGIPATLNRPALRKALHDLIAQSGYSEARYRLTIPRAHPDRVYITLEPFKPVPPDIQANGCRVVSVHRARHNPAAKTTDWYMARQSSRDAFPPGIYEGILVADDGTLLEGMSSNFYAVVNGTLRTAMEGVLEGISRRTLMKVAANVLPLDLRPVRLGDALDEAFISSAGRGIVPVVEIDGQPVGDGRPGPFTLRLGEAYNAWAAAHLEPVYQDK